jgi:hypothetical protein
MRMMFFFSLKSLNLTGFPETSTRLKSGAMFNEKEAHYAKTYGKDEKMVFYGDCGSCFSDDRNLTRNRRRYGIND